MSLSAPSSGTVRTVLGDVATRELGATNYHEHLFQVSPLLAGDEIDDETLSSVEAGLLLASGFSSMVDATPLGLGRNPEALARISEQRGLRIVATTGRHREAHYPDDHFARSFSESSLAARFTADLQEGLAQRDGEDALAKSPSGDAVRAGVLKAGIDYWAISRFEHQTLEAVAEAHAASGAPVMIHLEFCSGAHEVLDILESLRVPADSVCLAHADRVLDAGLHHSLAERGAYLGYDGMARWKNHSDEQLIDLTQRVVHAGGVERILLGGDVARRTRYVAYGGMPGLQYLGERYLPRLAGRLGDEIVTTLTTDNPSRWLAWRSL